MRWFRNIRCGVPVDQDPANPTQSTDFSLQLADSVQNFRAGQGEAKALSASPYQPSTNKLEDTHKSLSPYKIRIHGREQYKIIRGRNP